MIVVELVKVNIKTANNYPKRLIEVDLPIKRISARARLEHYQLKTEDLLGGII